MRRIAFLRGINVGGRRTTNDAMLGALAAAGLTHVQAYQASGNLVIDHDLDDDAALATLVGDAVAGVVGGPVDTFVRRCAALAAVAAAQPFSVERVTAAGGKPQVIFVHHAIDAPTAAEVETLGSAHDELIVDGQELFWLPTEGVSGSELDLAALERVVGPTTVRTHGTVQRLVAKFCG